MHLIIGKQIRSSTVAILADVLDQHVNSIGIGIACADRCSAETPMFPFDVILFDVGGVLLTNGWDHRERATVVEHFHLDRAEFERRHAESNDAWERDAISAGEYLDATVFYEPRSFSTRFSGFDLCAVAGLPNGALGILSELAASHMCMLGALNNEAREPNEYRFQNFGLREQVMWRSVRAIWDCANPDAAIYRRALDILGTPGSAHCLSTIVPKMRGGRERGDAGDLLSPERMRCAATCRHWKFFNGLEGERYATGIDWSGQDGRQHGRAASSRRPPGYRL